MKSKLLLIAISIFIFSSCSDMRYAGMQKVKHHPKSVVEAKTKTNQISPSEIKSIDDIQTELLVLNENKPLKQLENNKIEKAEKITISPKITKIANKIFPKITNKIQKDETQISERNSIDKNQTVQKIQVEKGSGLWYMLVGLLFLILGAVIGTGTVGYILWLVGVILIVYGLLTLLEVM